MPAVSEPAGLRLPARLRSPADRFPKQQPFEVVDDLVNLTAVQLVVDDVLIEHYYRRRQTISEHQRAIVVYLGMLEFCATEATLLERFVFEESCRLEQSTALQARTREFLKEQHYLEPAESGIAHLVGEQGKAAVEHILNVSPVEWDIVVILASISSIASSLGTGDGQR